MKKTIKQSNNLTIQPSSIAQAVAVSRLIPEFENPYDEVEYAKRMTGKAQLLLVATVDGQPAGFKVGYARDGDGTFYSWMGGILPAYRRMGIAQALASHQERWAKQQGYRAIRFKTRNYLKGMLHFALQNDFHIVQVIQTDSVATYRIVLEKVL